MNNNPTAPKPRGFAAMDPTKRRAICSLGGKSAHAQGRAYKFTPDAARIAGRLGGAKVAVDREHMARIGRIGGAVTSSDRSHMSKIGSLGGAK